MTFTLYVLLFLLVLGLIAVASNPSPYFAALGLVLVAGAGCGVLVVQDGPFLSLVLFLIYLGGMLVVFAYSAALAAEPYPESLGSRPVMGFIGAYGLGVLVAFLSFKGTSELSWGGGRAAPEMSVFRGDVAGVAVVYSCGGGMLMITAYILLLALLVALEVTRGLSRGTLRAV